MVVIGACTFCCAMEGASGATAKSVGVISFTFLSVLCTYTALRSRIQTVC